MKQYLIILLSVLSLPLWAQNVGIGTETPHASAALDITDTNKGLLIPRADTSDIANPAVGLLVYQLSDNGFYSYNGLQWKLIGKVSDKIEDEDMDTKIELEQNPDEDKIRFFTNGTEVLRQNGSTLETPNSGHSVFIGEEAGLNDDLTDNNNVFVGYRAGKENETGINNVAIGEQALQNSTGGNNNVAIGKQAMSLNSGSNNVGVGLNALQKNTSGQKNTGVGGFAGFANQTGNQNTHVGYEAGKGTATDVSGSVMIGHQAGKNETSSNKLYIANTDTDSPLIYGDFATKTLRVHDTLEVFDQISIGSPISTQQESAELSGAIQIGNATTDTPSTNDAGTVRWNEVATDYQGWDGTQWLSLTTTNEEIDCEIGTEIDTLPFIISEPGFYYLKKNLELNVSGFHGVEITVAHVTIDLNGFSITGPGNSGQSNHAGIKWVGIENISIKNGLIKGWQSSGISYESVFSQPSIGASVENMVLLENGNAGLNLTSYSTVKNCLSINNLGKGFSVGSSSLMESCISRGNNDYGFVMDDNVVLTKCISFSCTGGFSFGFGCKLVNCIARASSGAEGFKGIDFNNLSNCTAIYNGFSGFDLRSNNSLNNCVSTNNNSNGYAFDNDNTFIACNSIGNAEEGFLGNNGNTIKNCTSSGNDGNGITCVDYNSIKDCTITGNERSGIDVRHFNKIESNLISFNNTIQSTEEGGLDANIGNKIVGNSISDNYHIGITVNSHRNLLDGNDVINTRTSSGVPGIGFIFVSANNAWRNNTAVGNTGSNVSTVQPSASRSLNNWMY